MFNEHGFTAKLWALMICKLERSYLSILWNFEVDASIFFFATNQILTWNCRGAKQGVGSWAKMAATDNASSNTIFMMDSLKKLPALLALYIQEKEEDYVFIQIH